MNKKCACACEQFCASNAVIKQGRGKYYVYLLTNTTDIPLCYYKKILYEIV